MAKLLTEMAADIAAAQASHATMSGDEIGEFLRKTFKTLRDLKEVEDTGAQIEQPDDEGVESPLQLDPRRSIRRNKVICLVCGKEFKQLTSRHLKDHGLTLKEYRRKYGFSARESLAAKTLTNKRKKKAKETGLGEKLKSARRARAKKQASS
ncbi:MAG: transcriptional regulator [Desulfobacteraceae bacterium]|jgi:predicted transcriptional regulator|nr:MAG: transcriptional regulator [Desulfobacteraceae bacterium]